MSKTNTLFYNIIHFNLEKDFLFLLAQFIIMTQCNIILQHVILLKALKRKIKMWIITEFLAYIHCQTKKEECSLESDTTFIVFFYKLLTLVLKLILFQLFANDIYQFFLYL